LPEDQYLVLSFPRAFGDDAGADASPERLTRAERAVAAAAARGASNEDIARERRTSTRTVANQLASIYRKLGIASRAELAAHWHGVDLQPSPRAPASRDRRCASGRRGRRAR
jgi:DNA-binding NarL/FixJ family response regulator